MEKWAKQILHVWATSKNVANILSQAFDQLPTDLKSNTLVIVTVAKNAEEIFANVKRWYVARIVTEEVWKNECIWWLEEW